MLGRLRLPPRSTMRRHSHYPGPRIPLVAGTWDLSKSTDRARVRAMEFFRRVWPLLVALQPEICCQQPLALREVD
jgi:hypothetical protein